MNMINTESAVSVEVPTVKSKGLTARCMEFFGKLPGETSAEFAAELKALTPQDKQDLVAGFNAMGLPTTIVSA